MKKYIILLFAALSLTSCNNNQSNRNQSSANIPSRGQEIKSIIDTCLVKVPNFANNNITLKMVSDTLIKTIDGYIGNEATFIRDLPFRFEKAVVYEDEYLWEEDKYKQGKYLVSFMFDDKCYEPEKSTYYELHFGILSVVDQSMVINLKKDEEYFLSGIMYDYLNCGHNGRRLFRLPDGGCSECFPSIHLYDNTLDCSLGIIILDSITIQAVKSNADSR